MRDPLFSIVEPDDRLRSVIRRFLVLNFDEPRRVTFDAAIVGYNLIGWLYAGTATAWYNGVKLPWIDAPTLHADGVLYDEDVKVEFRGPFGQIFVEFTATGFYELTALSAGAYTGRGAILDVAEFPAGKTIFDLVEACHEFARPDMAEDLCDKLQETLIAMLPFSKPVPDYIRSAVAAIEAQDGDVRVADLMDDIPVSAQQFIRRFKHIVGLPPKKWAKILMMNKALEALIDQHGETLIAALNDTGYFDQSHFNRVVKDLMRVSPGRLLRDNSTVPPEFIGRLKKSLEKPSGVIGR